MNILTLSYCIAVILITLGFWLVWYLICLLYFNSYISFSLDPLPVQMLPHFTKLHHQPLLPPSLTPPLLLPHPLHPHLQPFYALAQPISNLVPSGSLTSSWEVGPTATETVASENVKGRYGRILPRPHHITTCLLLLLMPLAWSRSMEMPCPVGLTIGACWPICTPPLASSFSRSSPATLSGRERMSVKTQVWCDSFAGPEIWLVHP